MPNTFWIIFILCFSSAQAQLLEQISTSPIRTMVLKKGSILTEIKSQKSFKIDRDFFVKIKSYPNFKNEIYILNRSDQIQFKTLRSNMIDPKRVLQMYEEPEYFEQYAFDSIWKRSPVEKIIKWAFHSQAEISSLSSSSLAELTKDPKTKRGLKIGGELGLSYQPSLDYLFTGALLYQAQSFSHSNLDIANWSGLGIKLSGKFLPWNIGKMRFRQGVELQTFLTGKLNLGIAHDIKTTPTWDIGISLESFWKNKPGEFFTGLRLSLGSIGEISISGIGFYIGQRWGLKI